MVIEDLTEIIDIKPPFNNPVIGELQPFDETQIDKLKTLNDEFVLRDGNFIYTKEELTVDGLLTFDAQMRKIKEDEEMKLNLKLERCSISNNNEILKIKMRVKCLGLYKIGKPILTDIRHLSFRDRERLQIEMKKYESISIEDITNEFNDICKDELFCNGYDYSKLPVYDI